MSSLRLTYGAGYGAASVWLALAMGLSGCGPADVEVKASCLPGEAELLEVEAALADAKQLGVYLDVSQSSTNFGRGQGESPYRNLIAWLLNLTAEFEDARTYGFAEQIAEVDSEVFVQAARGVTNPCHNCGFTESRLDEVLARLAARESRKSFNVVVTDLWLDNSELVGSARLALLGPIRSILADGRAIGVLGVTAPYSSQVYDIPDSAGTTTIPAGQVSRRPVFALLIGPPAQVIALEQRLTLDVFMEGTIERHFALFTPALAATGPAELRLTANNPAVRQAYVLRIEGKNEPGFEIDGGAINPYAAMGEGAGVYLTAPIPSPRDGIPRSAGYELAAEMWTLWPPEPAKACEPGAWVPRSTEGVLDVLEQPDRFPLAGQPRAGDEPASDWMVRLAASRLGMLQPGDIAFLRYRVALGSLERGASWPDTWSFDAEDAPLLVAEPPALFPALNLTEFGRILELAMSEQVAGEIVAEGNVQIKVE